MLVIGLWHEFSFRYVLWGAWHGAGIVVWQGFQNIKKHLPTLTGAPKVLVDGASIAVTFHFVMLSFVLVHESELSRALNVHRILLAGWIE